MKPLTIDELKSLEVGDWVWVITPTNNGEYYEKGFASVSVGLGIGSYTYQYMTRDTLGFALKGTAEIING